VRPMSALSATHRRAAMAEPEPQHERVPDNQDQRPPLPQRQPGGSL
jgi:hypothetical protein